MKFYSYQKKCVVCRYWSGERELHRSAQFLEADQNDFGACLHHTSNSRHINNKKAIFTCPKWEKWDPLK